MLLSLILGIILGATTVVFALQNVALVTVTFASWHVTAPLAVLMLGCMLLGIVFALLLLLPFLIRDEIKARRILQEKRAIENALALTRTAPAPQPVAGVPGEAVLA